MAAETLIAIKGLDFAYPGGRKIFEDFKFEFFASQKTGLVGANGSGKSTLLQIIMGLLKPQQGVVELFGVPCKTEKDFRTARVKIGFVFQDANDQLFCPTVADDLAFGPLNLGYSREEADAIADDVLKTLGMEDFKNRITYNLSDGEKKLVAIGTALAMKPKMLILDEPTTCLDDNACSRIEQVLLNCGLPYLVVAHDRQFLEKVTTSRVRIVNGVLINDNC